MKIRNGFVSNSSSSSFIVGVGKVIDIDKFNKYVKDNNLKLNWDFNTMKVKDITTTIPYDSVIVDKSYVVVSSFMEDAKIHLKYLNPNDTIAVVHICNNEGDTGQFSWDENNGGNGIDYDMDLDYFESAQQAMYNAFTDSESGIDTKTSDIKFGAGRNG